MFSDKGITERAARAHATIFSETNVLPQLLQETAALPLEWPLPVYVCECSVNCMALSNYARCRAALTLCTMQTRLNPFKAVRSKKDLSKSKRLPRRRSPLVPTRRLPQYSPECTS